MMGSVFGKVLYQKRFMVLGWFLGTMALTAFTLAFFNSFSGGELGNSFKDLPPALQKVVGDLSSFTTISGYISQQLFALRVPLILIILSIALMIGLSAGEEQQGLTETHLTLPISRTSLLAQKLAAAITVLILASLGALVGVELGLLVARQSYDIFDVLPLLIPCVLLALNYGLIGLLVAAITGRRGLALGIASGFAFMSYLVDAMAVSVNALQSVDKLTFFYFYQVKGGFHWADTVVLAGVAVILISLSLLAFQSRDIRAR